MDLEERSPCCDAFITANNRCTSCLREFTTREIETETELDLDIQEDY